MYPDDIITTIASAQKPYNYSRNRPIVMRIVYALNIDSASILRDRVESWAATRAARELESLTINGDDLRADRRYERRLSHAGLCRV